MYSLKDKLVELKLKGHSCDDCCHYFTDTYTDNVIKNLCFMSKATYENPPLNNICEKWKKRIRG